MQLSSPAAAPAASHSPVPAPGMFSACVNPGVAQSSTLLSFQQLMNQNDIFSLSSDVPWAAFPAPLLRGKGWDQSPRPRGPWSAAGCPGAGSHEVSRNPLLNEKLISFF